MTTPIYDFVKRYAESKTSRFHMPGHKGEGALGCEGYDITEISGADVLYSADGIIGESEENLTSLYGTAHSFYSTEGSTLAIKAMLALVTQRSGGERPLVLAARNVHTAFIKAAALLDFDVEFIYSKNDSHLCACKISADEVREAIISADKKPRAVYITSPDYLGNLADIEGIAAVCREYGIPLLVDNAHGAYLKFLSKDMHPITLGAAMCADSAHKTLPVLTGGAYLHISADFAHLVPKTRGALSLFASTSPSYLTLSSLDLCNERLSNDYPEKIRAAAKMVGEIKEQISAMGLDVQEGEPLKIVIKEGAPLAKHLRLRGIEPEFSDRDFTVLMITPENTEGDFEALTSALSEYKAEAKGKENEAFTTAPHARVMSIREAILAPCESIPASQAEGRICALPTVSCPPAVPIVVSGEVITKADVEMLLYYGIEIIEVVK